MKTGNKTLNISEYDKSIIADVVLSFKDEKTPSEIAFYIRKIFKENINDSHIYYVGYLIGYYEATEESAEILQNNLQLCQRQN